MHAEEASQNFPTVQWHDEAAVITTLLDVFQPGVESDIQNNVAEVGQILDLPHMHQKLPCALFSFARC